MVEQQDASATETLHVGIEPQQLSQWRMNALIRLLPRTWSVLSKYSARMAVAASGGVVKKRVWLALMLAAVAKTPYRFLDGLLAMVRGVPVPLNSSSIAQMSSILISKNLSGMKGFLRICTSPNVFLLAASILLGSSSQ